MRVYASLAVVDKISFELVRGVCVSWCYWYMARIRSIPGTWYLVPITGVYGARSPCFECRGL